MAATGNFTCSDSLLTECMPQLSSLFSTSVQYDYSVPLEMFSDDATVEAPVHTADSIETIACSLSRDIHSSEVDPPRTRHDSWSVINLEPEDSIFSTGIAADDLSSLLEQFEEAAEGIDNEFGFDYLDFPKSVSEPATRVTSPIAESEFDELEVVKLLKAKSPLKVPAFPSSNCPAPTASVSVPVSPAHKPKVRRPSALGIKSTSQTTSSVVRRPSALGIKSTSQTTSSVSQITCALTPSPNGRVSDNYFKEIRDHDYCSNAPPKGRQSARKFSGETGATLTEDTSNPEGSMLKSLLTDSQLMAKMKQETFERRSSSCSNASTAEDAETPESSVHIVISQPENEDNPQSAVLVNGNVEVDFERVVDASEKSNTKCKKRESIQKARVEPTQQVMSTSNGPVPSGSVVSSRTVTRKPTAVQNVTTQKRTFTLDELIATDMQRKAIEKAQLEAILKTTPRSTPRSSPCQSPGKSDSPKLPDLPEIMALSNSASSKQGSDSKVSPGKRKAGFPGRADVPKVLQEKRGFCKPSAEQKEARPKIPHPKPKSSRAPPAHRVQKVVEKPKPEQKPSRTRTESKCLDIVDMEVDDVTEPVTIEEPVTRSMEPANFAAVNVLETEPKEKVVIASAFVTSAQTEKRAEMCEEIEKIEGVCHETEKEKANEIVDFSGVVPREMTGATTSMETMELSQSVVAKTEVESTLCDVKDAEDSNPVRDVESPGAEAEDDLYEAAMDIHVSPAEDTFPDSDDYYQFEAEATECNESFSTTDLNDNVPTAAVPAQKYPFVKDPLGLEGGEEAPVNTEQEPEVEKQTPNEKECNAKTRRSARNYRKRNSIDRASSEKEPVVCDKLPSYCKLLTVPNKYPQKSEVRAAKLVDNTLPERDRDPSPNRGSQAYSKVPSYVSNFANSTKYDVGTDLPPSASSSRSQSPSLVVAESRANSTSRPTSRNVSRESTPPKAYQRARSSSSSSSCSTCSSSSSDDSSRSRSRHGSARRSPDRSPRGGRTRRHSSRSRKSNRSRLRSRSRSRSPVNRRRHRRSSKSTSRSSSSYSRSRSRSRSRRRDRRIRGERHQKRERPYQHQPRRSESLERVWHEQQEDNDKRKGKQIEERRIVYVGRISPNLTRRQLRLQFERFGEIEETSVHLRESGGDHYGFVTFMYTCDAFAAIERGNKYSGLEKYDLCFGGRRQFCKETYADLDGNAEEEEEYSSVMPKRGGGGDLDFDALLKQTQKMIQKKKKPSS